ncbi:unnamed protein product [Ectocarpus sp. 13 AM-2016]
MYFLRVGSTRTRFPPGFAFFSPNKAVLEMKWPHRAVLFSRLEFFLNFDCGLRPSATAANL